MPLERILSRAHGRNELETRVCKRKTCRAEHRGRRRQRLLSPLAARQPPPMKMHRICLEPTARQHWWPNNLLIAAHAKSQEYYGRARPRGAVVETSVAFFARARSEVLATTREEINVSCRLSCRKRKNKRDTLHSLPLPTQRRRSRLPRSHRHSLLLSVAL